MSTQSTHVVVAPGADDRIGDRETIPYWTDGSRLALGAWTFSMPLIASVIAVANLLLAPDPPPFLLAATFGLFIAHAIIAMLYCAFAIQNPRIERARTTWLFGLLLAGPVIIPVYWVMHVWYAPRVVGPARRRVGEGPTDPPRFEARTAHAPA